MEIAILAILIVAIALLVIVLVNIKKGAKSTAVADNKEVLSAISSEANTIKSIVESSNSISSKIIFDGLSATNNQVLGTVKEMSRANEIRISEMKEELNKNLSDIRRNMSESLKDVREDNSKQLEEMRNVVDEKLSKTLNDRLNESFKMVSERLEAVSKGLGEMQSLSSGVTDLKKVLTNVKTRGTWGEVSLDALLNDILTVEQYEKNCNVGGRNCQQRVDFAIILPGSGEEKVYLPIDVKFPVEDYQRLGEALAEGNKEQYDLNIKQLVVRIKAEARTIKEKYIKPPHTTDFAILYLPNEGLYSEVIRQPGLIEELQNSFQVVPAGPTNIAALLSSLRMGFKALTIQKCSKEIFSVLMSFRKEFDKFADFVSRAQGQIEKASENLDSANKKTDAIKKQLDKVSRISLDAEEIPPLIG